MAKKKVKKTNSNSKKKNNKSNDKIAFAFVATFLSIIGFLIAIIAKKDDKYVMFYAKQSLVLVVASVILSVVSWVPILGWIAAIFGSIILVILWIIAWVNALSGKEKETPLIGQYAKKLHF